VADDLAVIANTGDDVEIYGVHVSPDPDLVTYWLAGEIDHRGYGLRDDTWSVMEALEHAGRPAWFRLGDRDLAMCLVRTELLRRGYRLTQAHAAVVDAMGVEARVLPMCDEPVRTHVRARGEWRPFQEFMIVDGARGPVEGVDLRGAADARPTEEVLAVLAEAKAIVIGPSNPIVSIGPILAVPGMREAVAGSPAPVVAVSPFVGGRAVKGPTEDFCAQAGIELSASGIATAYDGLLDGVVADERSAGVPALVMETLMDGADDRRRVAERTLEFAVSLTA
jgi:LPPG:FO 2-phospho-L-lactate transferase